MVREELKALTPLKELWMSLFDEGNFNTDYSNEDYRGLVMLLETSLATTKGLSSAHLNLKSCNERLMSQLEWKEKECNKLKIEVHRLENVSCEKCSKLEAEMMHYKKKAVEAQNRMKSIANILRIGETIQDSQSPRKASAFDLVSQMLLEGSPKRKKRCLPKSPSGKEDEDIAKDVSNCTTIVPETLPLLSMPSFHRTPTKNVEGTEIITSPGDGPSLATSKVPDMLELALGINLPSSKPSPSAKRNLSSKFQRKDVIPPTILQIDKTERQQHSIDELNGSLAEYVKESSSEFDKIWFTASTSKSINKSSMNKDKCTPSKGGDDIVEETPEKSPQKSKMVWKMKEKRGPLEHSGRKKLKQMKLSVSKKRKSNEVDLSTLTGYDGGSMDESGLDMTVLPESRPPLKERNSEEDDNKQILAPSLSSEEIDTPCLDSNDFNPRATSTQKPMPSLSSKKKTGSPDYVYKRDAVRKKSERAKLDGWDCTNCAEYYAAIGETSPSKMKERMNRCSRHRDKFKPVSNTPPGYWNPIVPDTQECREKGYYTSFRRPKPD